MPPIPLTAAGSSQGMEILAAQRVAETELNCVVSVFIHEFVVRRGGATVAYSGDLPLESSPEDFARPAVTGAARNILSNLPKIPGILPKLGSGERRESAAGRLTVTDPALGPAFALTLLLFRTYIFSEIQSPKEAWWQGE